MMQHRMCITGSKAKPVGRACEASYTERADKLQTGSSNHGVVAVLKMETLTVSSKAHAYICLTRMSYPGQSVSYTGRLVFVVK